MYVQCLEITILLLLIFKYFFFLRSYVCIVSLHPPGPCRPTSCSSLPAQAHGVPSFREQQRGQTQPGQLCSLSKLWWQESAGSIKTLPAQVFACYFRKLISTKFCNFPSCSMDPVIVVCHCCSEERRFSGRQWGIRQAFQWVWKHHTVSYNSTVSSNTSQRTCTVTSWGSDESSFCEDKERAQGGYGPEQGKILTSKRSLDAWSHWHHANKLVWKSETP